MNEWLWSPPVSQLRHQVATVLLDWLRAAVPSRIFRLQPEGPHTYGRIEVYKHISDCRMWITIKKDTLTVCTDANAAYHLEYTDPELLQKLAQLVTAL